MKVLITDIHHGNGGGHVTYILGLLRGLAHQCEFTLAAPATGRLYREASQIPGVRVLPGLYTARIGTALSEIWNLRRFCSAKPSISCIAMAVPIIVMS